MDGPLIFTSIDRFTLALWDCVKKWERSKVETFVTIEQMNSGKAEYIFDSNFKAARRRWKRERGNGDRCKLVIDCGGFPYVDYLGLSTLKMVYSDLMAAGVQTYFVVCKSEMKKLLKVTDFYTVVDTNRVFHKVDDAVKAAEKSASPPPARETLMALASIMTTDTVLADEENEEIESDNIEVQEKFDGSISSSSESLDLCTQENKKVLKNSVLHLNPFPTSIEHFSG